MNTTKIILSSSQLRELLEKELSNACGFDWTGWRIPIYLDLEENKGTFLSGGWLSNNSWQPDALEVYKIEKWDLDEDGVEYDENWTKVEEIENQIYYMLDDNIYDIQKEVEEKILNYFQNKYYSNDETFEEIEIEWKD